MNDLLPYVIHKYETNLIMCFFKCNILLLQVIIFDFLSFDCVIQITCNLLPSSTANMQHSYIVLLLVFNIIVFFMFV